MPDKLHAERVEAHLRVLIETAHDGIISADHSGDITLFNHAAERIFGWLADDILGRPLTTLLPPAEREKYQTALQRFVSTGSSEMMGRTMHVTGYRRDGSEFPIDLSLASWRADDDLYFTVIVRDVTERMRV